MLLPEVYPGSAVIDVRAVKRDRVAPVTISVRAMGDGSTAEHVDAVVKLSPMPCAYVAANGQVWILTGGGSGVIAFAGDDPNLDQGDKISLLVESLEALGGQVESFDDSEPVKPKRKNRKQVEVEAEPVGVSGDVVESATDVMAWTVDDEGDPF